MPSQTKLTIAIDEEQKKALKQIAFDLGFRWGEDGNLTQMLEAIARHELIVYRPENRDEHRSTLVIKNLTQKLAEEVSNLRAAGG